MRTAGDGEGVREEGRYLQSIIMTWQHGEDTDHTDKDAGINHDTRACKKECAPTMPSGQHPNGYTRKNKTQFIRSCHPLQVAALQGFFGRMQPTLHATRPTPNASLRAFGASNNACLPGREKPDVAPSRYWNDARVYGRKTRHNPGK